MEANKRNVGSGIAACRIVRRAGLVATVALLTLPLALWAHAHLRRSEPAADARLASPPSAIRLWFTERPELAFTRVRLHRADSSETALGAPARMTDDAMGVTVPIATSMAAGKYTVLWRTAAADGHASSGSFTFELTGVTAPAVAAVDTTPRAASGHAIVRTDTAAERSTSLNASAAARWLEFMALLAVVGAVVFSMGVLPRAARAMAGALPNETRSEIADTARRLAQGGSILLLIMALSRLYGEARSVFGANRPIDRSAIAALLGTHWGVGWSIGVGGVVVAALGFALVRRARDVGWMMAAAGAAAAACSPALTGHASATQPVGLAILTDVAHVLAASAWLGTLLTLLFAALPVVRGTRSMAGISSGALVASLVRAFHPVALTCAAVVVASGLLSAWLRLPTVASLWESTYGRILLLKVAFVALVVVLGAINWRRVLPTLGDDGAARRITRTAGAELMVAALVLAVTAVLVSTSPPAPTGGATTLSVRR